MINIILKKRRDESVKRFHPWIFSGAIDKTSAVPQEGDIVRVFSHEGEFLGSGHWNNGSIAVRMLLFEEGEIDVRFFTERIHKALNLRMVTGIAPGGNTSAYRLVHGEGDNLPGLIIDVYNDTFVVQAHSFGMYKAIGEIKMALKEVFGEKLKAVYNKSSSTISVKDIVSFPDGYIEGNSESPVAVFENGKEFLVDWVNGQKTGFFLDQRDNRALVESLSRGRRVLNLFSYTGGFSVYALAGGAVSADSVDSSRIVKELIEKNIDINRKSGLIPYDSTHNFFCTDVNSFLKDCKDGQYDLIIVDPPAFAKHRDSVSNALRGYQRLNAAVIEKISAGGLIFTFSCSQAIDREAFSLAIFSAAAQAKRKVRILSRLTQPADHPVNIFHPEGDYLKGLLLYVE